MSREQREITEYDLHAYADGELDEPARATIQAHLAENPAAAEEVDGWRRQNETLRALYGHIAAQPVPARLGLYRIERERRARAGHRSQMAAAAILLIAIGTAAGWYGHGIFTPAPAVRSGLVDEAMEAHRIYSSEVAHPVEVWAGQKDHLQAWLSKRLARPLTVPDLRADGLTLIGGRLLPAQNGPAAQFMYEDDTGHRVTLYIIPAKEGRET
jgi:anti-sigma factor RsiW